MRLYLKTAGSTCYLWLNDQAFQAEFGRELSTKLLSFINQSLTGLDKTWSDINDIVVFKGPGSYTSLRIGLTVANTLANGLNIPIVGTKTDDWRTLGDQLLADNKNQQIITPIYYQDAVITQPKK